jgi:hypothetical protein
MDAPSRPPDLMDPLDRLIAREQQRLRARARELTVRQLEQDALVAVIEAHIKEDE